MISPISERKVPFFTPVESEAYPLIKVFDHYFWFGGQVADVAAPEVLEGTSIGARKKQGETNQVATILKIVSMIASLGILPLLALAIKAIIRCTYQFHWIQNSPAVAGSDDASPHTRVRTQEVPPATVPTGMTAEDLAQLLEQDAADFRSTEGTERNSVADEARAPTEAEPTTPPRNAAHALTPPRRPTRGQAFRASYIQTNQEIVSPLPAHGVRVRNIYDSIMGLPPQSAAAFAPGDSELELGRVEETLRDLELVRNQSSENPFCEATIEEVSALNRRLDSLNSLSDAQIIKRFAEKRNLEAIANNWPVTRLTESELLAYYQANYPPSSSFVGLHGRLLVDWLVIQQERETSHTTASENRALADQQNREYEEALAIDRMAAEEAARLETLPSSAEPEVAVDAGAQPSPTSPPPELEVPRPNAEQARQIRAAAVERCSKALNSDSIVSSTPLPNQERVREARAATLGRLAAVPSKRSRLTVNLPLPQNVQFGPFINRLMGEELANISQIPLIEWLENASELVQIHHWVIAILNSGQQTTAAQKSMIEKLEHCIKIYSDFSRDEILSHYPNQQNLAIDPKLAGWNLIVHLEDLESVRSQIS